MILTLVLTFGISLATKLPQQLLDQKSEEILTPFIHHSRTDVVSSGCGEQWVWYEQWGAVLYIQAMVLVWCVISGLMWHSTSGKTTNKSHWPLSIAFA